MKEGSERKMENRGDRDKQAKDRYKRYAVKCE